MWYFHMLSDKAAFTALIAVIIANDFIIARLYRLGMGISSKSNIKKSLGIIRLLFDYSKIAPFPVCMTHVTLLD